MTTEHAQRRSRPLLDFGVKVGGVLKSVEVVECRRLHVCRTRFFNKHGDATAFRNLHGRDFTGTFTDFMALSLRTRTLIESDLRKDITEHRHEWEQSNARETVAVVETRAEKPNLFLTQGINNLLNYTTNPSQVSKYCVAGTGTTTPAASDTSLEGEVRRSTSYLTGAGNCGTTTSTGTGTRTWTYKRTYDFGIESSSQNYAKLGWSHTATVGANIASETLISGGTVTVAIGQALRAVYELSFVVSTATQSGTFSMGEWGSVDYDACLVNANLPSVDTDGGGNTAYSILCPGSGTYTDAIVFPVSGDFAIGYGATSGYTALVSEISTGNGAWGSYTAGTGTRTLNWSGVFSGASFSSTAIRGFIYRVFNASLNRYDCFAIKFGSAKTKTTLQQLKPNGISVSYSA